MKAAAARPAWRSTVRLEPTPKALLLAVLTVAASWVALQLLPVLLVVVAALLLVGTLNPAVEWLERKGLKRTRAIALVFVVMFIAAGLVLALTVPALVEQVGGLVGQEPQLRGHLAGWLASSRVTAPLADSLRSVRYESLIKESAGSALAYSKRGVELVAYLVTSVFLALYLMLDRDRVRGGLFAAVPRRHHVRLSRVLLNLETIVGGYIRGQVLTSVFMTAFTLALLLACGVHSALAIAAFAGLADVLPYVGVFLSVGPAVAAALARGPVVVAIVLVAMLAYEELESRFLVPKIYGKALRLPSSVVLVALLAGGTLMGIVGALLALPAAAATRMLIEELRVDLPGEQGDDGEVRARDELADEEYERRAEGISAKRAAAIAVEIAEERRDQESSEGTAPSSTGDGTR